MGMYTEFIFGCELKKEIPRECIEALDYVINGEEKKPKYENPKQYSKEETYNKEYIDRTLPIEEIEAFIEKYDLWRLFCSSSYYFGASDPVHSFRYDSISNSYIVSIRANCKNYEGQIDTFIEYIKPWVASGSGYEHHIFAMKQYEGDEFPTIYGIDGTYTVNDKEYEEKIAEREDDRWRTIGKLQELAPEFKVTKEILEKNGVDPQNYNIEDGIKIFIDYIIDKYKNK